MGKLLWVCGQTKPDISFEVCQLATNIKNSDEPSTRKVNKLFSNTKLKECKFIYQKLGNDDLRIIVYSDVLTETFQMEVVKASIFSCGYRNVCSVKLAIKTHMKNGMKFSCS